MKLLSERGIKKEIIGIMKRLYEKGLITSQEGNASYRIPGRTEIWITPSGDFKGNLNENRLVKVNFDGKIIKGKSKPSIEWRTHVTIYKVRGDIHAIVHAHNPLTIALTLSGIRIFPVRAEEERVLGEIKIIPYAPPGTSRLAELIRKHIEKQTKVLILERHGVLGLGQSLLEACNRVEVLEDTAKVILTHILIKGKIPSHLKEMSY